MAAPRTLGDAAKVDSDDSSRLGAGGASYEGK